MHVLIIPSERYVPKDNHLHGIFQQHQAHALVRAGYQVGVISPFLRRLGLAGLKTGSWLRKIEVTDDCGVSVMRYFGWRLPRIRRIIFWQWMHAGLVLFREYVKRYGYPDMVHAHNALWAGCLAARIKKMAGIPYVLTEHSSAYARGLVYQHDLELAAEAYRKANRRLVVSPGLGSNLEKALGDMVQPWTYVPNILPTRFQEIHLEQLSTAHNNASFRFLSAGSLDENKGHSDLLYAFARSFKQKNNVQLIIVGEGPLGQKLKSLSHELGINQQVTFLGKIDHEGMLAEMSACDALVLSSRYETFGVVVIEALACGKPVVATRCGGPEWIVHEGNGLLVPVRDIAALGHAMLAIKNSAHRFDSRQIRQDCIARFGEKTVIRLLSEVYSQILAEWRT